MDKSMEEYTLAWSLEEAAKLQGWHIYHRMVTPRRVVITFEKDFEPEPGAGKDDPA